MSLVVFINKIEENPNGIETHKTTSFPAFI